MIREQSISIAAAGKLSTEETKDKIITGVLHERGDRPEFVETMARLRRA